MLHRLAAILLILTAGCSSAPQQSQEAVKQAILDHLGKRADMLAASMRIEVVSVSFREKEADAIVSVSPKEGGEGMQMTYTLAAEGGKWVVKKSGSGGAAPHAPVPGSPSGALPPGHPPIEGKGKSPH